MIAENSPEYVYAERSCKNCAGAEDCLALKRRDENFEWLDCAKCGCLNYHGEFENELRLRYFSKCEEKVLTRKYEERDKIVRPKKYTQAERVAIAAECRSMYLSYVSAMSQMENVAEEEIENKRNTKLNAIRQVILNRLVRYDLFTFRQCEEATGIYMQSVYRSVIKADAPEGELLDLKTRFDNTLKNQKK